MTLALELRTTRDRIRLVNMVMPAAATTLGFAWLLGHPIALGPFLSHGRAQYPARRCHGRE